MSEQFFEMDDESRRLFDSKGVKGNKLQAHNVNDLKVRRVMQIIKDFSKKPFNELRILDLACGEGVYAIEAALHGAAVMAIDARRERMGEGIRAANRLGLKNSYIRFMLDDVRCVNLGVNGSFDVVLFLGILYHLDKEHIYQVLNNIYWMTEQFVIIDTHIALQSVNEVKYNGRMYEGKQYREHGDDDPDELRRSRQLASIDNPLSFWFTKESLLRLLRHIGFTSVCEVSVPLEPNKPENRITLVAMKGEPVVISTYPWVNENI